MSNSRAFASVTSVRPYLLPLRHVGLLLLLLLFCSDGKKSVIRRLLSDVCLVMCRAVKCLQRLSLPPQLGVTSKPRPFRRAQPFISSLFRFCAKLWWQKIMALQERLSMGTRHFMMTNLAVAFVVKGPK